MSESPTAVERIDSDNHADPLPGAALGLCNEEHRFLPSENGTFTERCTALLCRDHVWHPGMAQVLYMDGVCRAEPIWVRDEPQPDWSDFPCVTGYPPDHYLQHAEERARALQESNERLVAGRAERQRTVRSPMLGKDPEYVRLVAERKWREQAS